jgi:NADH dehydrogenase FAD-containing subunit
LEDFLVVVRPLKSFKEVHRSVRVLEDKVTALDVTGRVVGTAGGGRFHYGKLCLCLGAVPNTLFPRHERVIAIRDTQSIQQLVERVKSSRRILLLGNGGIAAGVVHAPEGVEII